MVKIISDYGYCYGVENAINILKNTKGKVSHLYLTHSLIHNKSENDKLMKENNASLYNGEELSNSDGILFSAHGHGKVEEEKYKDKAILFDATCPLILSRYKSLNSINTTNTTFFFIGKKNHQETNGFLSNFPFLNFIDSQSDIKSQIDSFEKKENLALIPQTTISKKIYDETLEYLSSTGNVVFKMPICQLYSNRVKQSLEFLKSVDISKSCCLVLGDESSSNAREIKKAIQDSYKDLYVQIALSLDNLDLDKIIGKDIYLTSATSCPKEKVEEMKSILENL